MKTTRLKTEATGQAAPFATKREFLILFKVKISAKITQGNDNRKKKSIIFIIICKNNRNGWPANIKFRKNPSLWE